jgi:hypothetical protein
MGAGQMFQVFSGTYNESPSISAGTAGNYKNLHAVPALPPDPISNAGVNNFIAEASQAAWNVWTLAFYRSSLLGDDGAEAQTANVSPVDSGNTVSLVCTTGGHRYTREIPPISEFRSFNSHRLCTFVP